MKLVISSLVIIGMLIMARTAFPSENWKSMDIGNTKAGSTDIKGDVITINANGTDIWGAADECRYVYQEVNGNFEISAMFVSLERANEWSKSGLMVRQSLDANSQNAFLNVTPDYGVKLIHRDAPGADTGPSPWEKNFECPIWLKLVKKENEFSSFWSKDGKNWDPAEVPGTPSIAEISMTDPVFVGIAVTSHAFGILTKAVVEKVQGGGSLSLPVETVGSNIVTWGEIKAR
jgi:hypothetical protein